MKVINLTPHEVRVARPLEDIPSIVYPVHPSRYIARASSKKQTLLVGLEDGTEIYTAPQLGGLIDPLPDEVLAGQDQIVQLLIMSEIGARAAKKSGYRGSIAVPDSGPDSAIRGETGQIVGVRRLYMFNE